MYDTTLICNYMNIKDSLESNELYQKELLSVFGFSEFTDSLHEHISELHKNLNYPIHDILKSVPFNYTTDPEILIMILFSYDYFAYTHSFLVKVLMKEDPTAMKEELMAVLKK